MQINILFGICCGKLVVTFTCQTSTSSCMWRLIKKHLIQVLNKCFRPRFVIVIFVNYYTFYLFLRCANTWQQTINSSHLDRSWKLSHCIQRSAFWILIFLLRILFQQMQRCFCCPSKSFFILRVKPIRVCMADPPVIHGIHR